MDPQTLRQINDWVAFFREIGLEDFYVRSQAIQAAPSGPAGEAAATLAGKSQAASAELVEQSPASLSASLPAAHTSTVEPPRLAVQTPAPQTLSLFDAPAPAAPTQESLEQIRADLGECQRCKLWGGRKHIVFGQGSALARLVLVGEGPGADEDEQGLPFVGRAGQLLNKMLRLIDLPREDVYICNVVKCRPPGNRTPETDEVAACSPFLLRQIAAIRPRLICCLGVPATRTVLGIKEGITRIHGRLYDYGEIKAMATVHPAYVLRSPREEVILREDFEKIRDFLRQSKPEARN